jgi:hypothetical protein
MDDKLKKILYLTEYNNKKDKKVILENVNALLESKQTEQQALAILRKGNVADNIAFNVVNRIKGSDTSRNQVLIPILAKAYLEAGENGMNNLLDLTASMSELINSNRINVPQLSNSGGYIVNNKTFNNYLRLSEFIHGLEQMSKGYAEWKGKVTVDTNEKPIWEGNGIKIYDGNDVGKCIHYTSGALTGKHYGFCIGQPANTMWQSYRDTKTSTFHYVIDETRDLSDPLHIVVVDATQHGIELTDANNSTGKIAQFGNDVNGYLKYLQSKGVPTDKLFINKPKTPEEKVETEKLGTRNEDLEWFKELTFEEKSKYIGRGHLLGDEQFKYLWQFKNDKGGFSLLHQYVDTGQPIPENQFNILINEQ